MRYYISFLLVFFFLSQTSAQELRNPFDFAPLLSGNFGELRSNHFHSGIDFKTQGVEGKPVRAVQEGYVSRISVSPWGYGNALYLTHPDGTTTVYGHLQKFTNEITSYVKEQQYTQESFTINLTLTPEQFPINKGEVIAFSGNTGGSGGPHLHFEVRDTKTEEALDPIDFYKNILKDTQAPKITGVMVYPIAGKGVVNNNSRKVELKPTTTKEGKQLLSGKLEAWGEITLAVKAFDYMNETNNIFGVKEISLMSDNATIFHSYIDRYAFDESRYINSFIDYEEWKERNSYYMKSFVDPGNRLRFIESTNRGIIHIDEERDYHLTYILKDAFGNTSKINISLKGKEQPIIEPDTTGTERFHWRSENRFGAKGVRLTVPAGILYDDILFRYSVREDSLALAALHTLHSRSIPLHKTAQLSIRLQHDTISDKQKYGIISRNNNRPQWIGGTYRNGWIDADIRELGNYTIAYDNTSPTITPINQATWISKQKIQFRISDNLSGIKSYRGEIDGSYVLFEMDGKSGLIAYTFDKKKLNRGNHQLRLIVTDACGNEATYDYSFVW